MSNSLINRNTISPSIWGPSAWDFLYNIAYTYPNNPDESIKENYKRFFMSLKYILPCDSCMVNYKNHTETISIDNYLDSSLRLVEWLVKINNEVNKVLNKSPILVSDKIKEIESKSSKNNNFYMMLICGVIIAGVSFYLLKKKK